MGPPEPVTPFRFDKSESVSRTENQKSRVGPSYTTDGIPRRHLQRYFHTETHDFPRPAEYYKTTHELEIFFLCWCFCWPRVHFGKQQCRACGYSGKCHAGCTEVAAHRTYSPPPAPGASLSRSVPLLFRPQRRRSVVSATPARRRLLSTLTTGTICCLYFRQEQAPCCSSWSPPETKRGGCTLLLYTYSPLHVAGGNTCFF